MKRRDMLKSTGAAIVGLSAFPFGWVAAAEKTKRQRVLYFTRSAGFEHSVVRRKDGELSHSERILTELGKRAGFEVTCTKDGRVFDGDLSQYDAFALYATGDLTSAESRDNTPPMSPAGKQKLLDAVAAGTGVVGIHAATDAFLSHGDKNANQTKIDPYLAMLGGEFVSHNAQQEATMRVVDPTFPGMTDLGRSFRLHEEWYALKNFAPDMHVLLVQETEGMTGGAYQRPPFPATWARMQGKGRVYYTSLGHREDIWTNPMVQNILLGGFAWALGNADAKLAPNLEQVAPGADELTRG